MVVYQVAVLSEKLFYIVTEHACGCLIDERMASVHIQSENAVPCRVEDQFCSPAEQTVSFLAAPDRDERMQQPVPVKSDKSIKHQRGQKHIEPAFEGLQTADRIGVSAQQFHDPVGRDDPNPSHEGINQRDRSWGKSVCQSFVWRLQLTVLHT